MFAYFLAATRSVGTAATMAYAGVYLHRHNYITSDGKKLLALLSQQITIPLLLFTKVVYCDVKQQPEYSTSDHATCPSILENIRHTWILLLWPIYVVAWGLVIGFFASEFTHTYKSHRCAIMASCGFANSTGLPITLLAVIRANMPPDTELGKVDPALFLSMYLLLYPVLQWGIGSWLLSPTTTSNRLLLDHSEEGTDQNMNDLYLSTQETITDPKHKPMLELSPPALELQSFQQTTHLVKNIAYTREDVQLSKSLVSSSVLRDIVQNAFQPPVIGALLGIIVSSIRPLRGIFVNLSTPNPIVHTIGTNTTSAIASTIDTETTIYSAPILGWFFDGLYNIGQAAIPINMIILGVNLASFYLQSGSSTVTSQYHAHRKDSHSLQETDKMDDTDNDIHRKFSTTLSYRTIAAAVLGKMVVMPLIGILSIYLLQKFVLDIPDVIGDSFYLVLMIVFITPTANNVMVMVELGGGPKEIMAALIGWQYVSSPIFLSLSVTILVHISTSY